MIGTDPMNRKPIPKPKQIPWLRNKCQIFVAKDAPMKLAVSRNTPVKSVTWVPKKRVDVVATGDMSMAQEIEREPTKAYSSGVAPGNVSFAR